MKSVFKAVNGVRDCSRPKLWQVHDPKTNYARKKPFTHRSQIPNLCTSTSSSSSSSSSSDHHKPINGTTSSSSSSSVDVDDSESETDRMISQQPPCSKIIDSVAVVKDSNDPFRDFHDSMLEMISEKELYSEHDLQELLHCFLKLNASRHHASILRAFMVIVGRFGDDRLRTELRGLN